MSSKKRRKRALPLEQGGTQKKGKRLKLSDISTAKQLKDYKKQATREKIYKAKSDIKQRLDNYRRTNKNKALHIEIPKGYMKVWGLDKKRNINSAKDARQAIRDYLMANVKISGQWLYNVGYEPGNGRFSDSPSDDPFLEFFLGENEGARYFNNGGGYTLSELYDFAKKSKHPEAMKFYRYVKSLYEVEIKKGLR